MWILQSLTLKKKMKFLSSWGDHSYVPQGKMSDLDTSELRLEFWKEKMIIKVYKGIQLWEDNLEDKHEKK